MALSDGAGEGQWLSLVLYSRFDGLFSAQLRHVPMVHVMHCEGRGWHFDANDEFHMELWGNHAIIRPVGELFVHFSDGDEYCWSTARNHTHLFQAL